MTSYPSTRYRCDHCRKTSGSAPAMKRHESGCTANPQRRCGMCKQNQHTPLPDLIAALGAGDKAGVDALRDAAEGCPACMLAAIRQSGLQRATTFGPEGIEDDGFRVPFDFNAEKESWWADRNDEYDAACHHG